MSEAKSQLMPHAAAKEALKKLNNWELLEPFEQPSLIQKTFRFPDYLSGLAFVQKAALAAEKANHHPDLLLTWGKVTVTLSTHDSGGLTQKDFDLAAEYDRLAEGN